TRADVIRRSSSSVLARARTILPLSLGSFGLSRLGSPPGLGSLGLVLQHVSHTNDSNDRSINHGTVRGALFDCFTVISSLVVLCIWYFEEDFFIYIFCYLGHGVANRYLITRPQQKQVSTQPIITANLYYIRHTS
ncbi:hypothetical protein C8R48DRAFT_723185, partial [Suillus tomentosus]